MDARGREELARRRPTVPAGPKQPEDPLVDEVRALRDALSARFDHDLDRLCEHLRETQARIEREQPGRVVRPDPNRRRAAES
jgi:hypothetical protein